MIMLTVFKYIALLVAALVLIVFIFILVWSWGRGRLVYAENKNGVSYIESSSMSEKVSVKQALALAEPYLKKTLEQIRKDRGSTHETWGGRTYVILKDKWYYIFKDDYPWKAPVLELPGRYENLAIRVNIDTGELNQPVWPD